MSATRLSAIVLRWHNSPYMAQKIEREALAAGWVSPEAARQAKADLENAREAGKVYRQRAEKAEAEVKRLQKVVGDRLGDCVGCVDAPEEYCPLHGRPYTDAVDHMASGARYHSERADEADRERRTWREAALRYGPPEEDLVEEVLGS